MKVSPESGQLLSDLKCHGRTWSFLVQHSRLIMSLFSQIVSACANFKIVWLLPSTNPTRRKSAIPHMRNGCINQPRDVHLCRSAFHYRPIKKLTQENSWRRRKTLLWIGRGTERAVQVLSTMSPIQRCSRCVVAWEVKQSCLHSCTVVVENHHWCCLFIYQYWEPSLLLW